MTIVILFVFGLIIGSFLNVVALRYNSGLTLSGRSRCPSCGRTLRALELVPVLSFLLSRARCRSCQSRISLQYPLVELWTGLVFATVFDPTLGSLANALLLAVFSVYIAITIYDAKHQIIPDGMVFASAILAFAFRVQAGGGAGDYLAGPAIALFFAAIWLASKGRAMGFGDAKLALSIGLLLGLETGISATVLSFWIGAAFGLALMIFSRINPLSGERKRITIKSAIPFAPFLVLGAWLALIFKLDLLHVSIF
jgi:prepilin signal peptidase PulO-like enzyme (type II secretory pathway)